MHRCVERCDHHCPWLLNCVAARNHRYFVALVFSVGLAHLIHLVLNVCFLWSKPTSSLTDAWGARSWYLLLNDLFGLPFAVSLAVTSAIGVWRNITTNEYANQHRYGYLMDPATGEFANPFDRGARHNCAEFWGCRRRVQPRDVVGLRLAPPTQQVCQGWVDGWMGALHFFSRVLEFGSFAHWQ